MPRRTRKLPAEVKQLSDRIERWRRTRAKRTTMPAELWSAAIELARREGAYRIAHALRLSIDGLKRRMLESAAGEMAMGRSHAFVELTGAQILGASPPAGTTVEVVDAAGSRLSVRLAAESAVDVAQMISAFRQRSDR
jgi:hypothetical protein